MIRYFFLFYFLTSIYPHTISNIFILKHTNKIFHYFRIVIIVITVHTQGIHHITRFINERYNVISAFYIVYIYVLLFFLSDQKWFFLA